MPKSNIGLRRPREEALIRSLYTSKGEEDEEKRKNEKVHVSL